MKKRYMLYKQKIVFRRRKFDFRDRDREINIF